jgi:polyribonucleotide nucleotidyltransferase
MIMENNLFIKKSIDLGGKTLSVETGKIARQSDGSVIVQYGDTVILATVVASKEPAEYRGFFPLSVEYREKAYAAGKIPGGFFKREGRPHDKEILSARLIDRPIRPLFPKGFINEVQVVITVLSSDKENDADVLGIIGASTALSISDIPFNGPIAGVRVGRLEGEFVINPTFSDLDRSDLNMVVAASNDALAMVEGEAVEMSEKDVVASLEFGHEAIKQIICLQEEIISEFGKEKRALEPIEIDSDLSQSVIKEAMAEFPDLLKTEGKMERNKGLNNLLKSIKEHLAESYPDQEMMIEEIFHEAEKKYIRKMIIEKKIRIDGRKYDDIRDITCEISVLPRTHGSAIFTRGETQSLTVFLTQSVLFPISLNLMGHLQWLQYVLVLYL